MSINLGLDFGTTYSVLSYLNDDGVPVAWQPSEGSHMSPCIDTVVVNRRNRFEFGASARSYMGWPDTVTYRGFKMLLSETDSGVLANRGYTGDNTPKSITRLYLEDLLRRYLVSTPSVEKINKLVVGVPEIWFSELSTVNSRTILEDTLNEIFASLPSKTSVELVSEPAAACAYFADTYKKKKNAAFKGHILVVDYGGGTLDIALCEVKENGVRSEVTVIKRCGAGVNEEGILGKAGMAFIEDVAVRALLSTGKSEEEIRSSKVFYKAVRHIENELMQKTAEIGSVLDEHNPELEDFETLEDDFCDCEIGDDIVCVTYGMLMQSYNKIIRTTLKEKLDEVQEFMRSRGIKFGTDATEGFKIAPVGGFCNFYLTQKQIEEAFKWRGKNDPRFTDIIVDRRECERAIAYGTALIANQVIDFHQVAPYSVGIVQEATVDEDCQYYFAIKKGDEIVFDDPCYAKYDNGEIVVFRGKLIPRFAFNDSDDCNPDATEAISPLKEHEEKVSLPTGTKCQIGFSFTRSMNPVLHKKIFTEDNQVISEQTEHFKDIYDLLGHLRAVNRRKK